MQGRQDMMHILRKLVLVLLRFACHCHENQTPTSARCTRASTRLLKLQMHSKLLLDIEVPLDAAPYRKDIRTNRD